MSEIIGYHGTTIPNGQQIKEKGFFPKTPVHFVLEPNKLIAIDHALDKSRQENLPTGYAIVTLQTRQLDKSSIDPRYYTCCPEDLSIVNIYFSRDPEIYRQMTEIIRGVDSC